MKWHPDKNFNVKQAENKFKEIQQAYETLGDPRSRGGYDHNLRNSVRFGRPFHAPRHYTLTCLQRK